MNMSNAVVVSRPSGFADPLFRHLSPSSQGSNADDASREQGQVYAAVIERVIEASKNDFEEAGADQQTLEDFMKVCRPSQLLDPLTVIEARLHYFLSPFAH